MTDDRPRLDRAIAAIDAANAHDPRHVEVDGDEVPLELAHARMVTEWVRRLRPDATEALLLAARAHHLRRWEVPRSTEPAGRKGYLRWRRDLEDRHARDLAAIMESVGYDDATVARASAIVRKEGLRDDPPEPEVQTFEDALCLVFLATQLADVAARLDDEKVRHVLRRTVAKMSPAGRAASADLALSDETRALLTRALADAT